MVGFSATTGSSATTGLSATTGSSGTTGFSTTTGSSGTTGFSTTTGVSTTAGSSAATGFSVTTGFSVGVSTVGVSTGSSDAFAAILCASIAFLIASSLPVVGEARTLTAKTKTIATKNFAMMERLRRTEAAATTYPLTTTNAQIEFG